MNGKVLSTTRRDGVICTLTSVDDVLVLSVVDLKTGAPTGTVKFPVGAAGAVVWTIQSIYDEEKSTSEKTETKKRAKKRAKKE